LHGVEGT